jgi:hypothetical protein
MFTPPALGLSKSGAKDNSRAGGRSPLRFTEALRAEASESEALFLRSRVLNRKRGKEFLFSQILLCERAALAMIIGA